MTGFIENLSHVLTPHFGTWREDVAAKCPLLNAAI